MHTTRLIALALLTLLFLAGCRSPKDGLDRRYTEVGEIYGDDALRPKSETALTWADAKARMLENNLEITESYNGILQARESTQRVFLDLLPSLSVSANLSRQITDFSNLSGDDVNYGVFSSINIPGIVRLRVNHYAALIQEIRAGWAWELARRERVVQIRSLFIRQKNLNRRAEMLSLAGTQEDRSGLDLSNLGKRPAELERRDRLWQLQRQEDRLQQDISSLLNDYSSKWILDVSTIPELYVDEGVPDIHDLDNFGVLWRQLKAVELERARLTELGAKISYWPDLSLNITSPPLYQRSGGTERDFDIDAVTASFRTNVRIDTDLRNAFRLRQIRRSNALVLDMLRAESANLLLRLKDAMEAYKLNQAEALIAQTQYELLIDALADAQLTNTDNQLESLLRLEDQLVRIENEQAEFEALFWALDESKWERLSFETLLADAKDKETRLSFID